MSTCRRCSSPVEVTTRDVVYPGLPGVIIAGAQLISCTGCDFRATRYPNAANIDRVIARQIASHPSPLRPERLRFLRTVLLLSGKEFAHHVGVAPETVSRWENGKQPHPRWAEQLLRAWVRSMPDGEDGIGPWLIEVGSQSDEPAPIRIQPATWSAAPRRETA